LNASFRYCDVIAYTPFIAGITLFCHLTTNPHSTYHTPICQIHNHMAIISPEFFLNCFILSVFWYWHSNTYGEALDFSGRKKLQSRVWSSLSGTIRPGYLLALACFSSPKLPIISPSLGTFVESLYLVLGSLRARPHFSFTSILGLSLHSPIFLSSFGPLPASTLLVSLSLALKPCVAQIHPQSAPPVNPPTPHLHCVPA
jgi:hypothetical protein